MEQLHQWLHSEPFERAHRPFSVKTYVSLCIFLQGHAQSLGVPPAFPALIDIAVCGLRGYIRETMVETETEVGPAYLTKNADREERDPEACLGFGIAATLK